MKTPTSRTYWFSVPFRTSLSLDTPIIELHRDATCRALSAAAMLLANERIAARSPWVLASGDGERRFKSLSDDAGQEYVTPLLEIAVGRVMNAVLRRDWRLDPRLGRPRAMLFDNTVAVLEWGGVVCVDTHEDPREIPVAIEDEARTASEDAIARIQARLLPRVHRALVAAFARQSGQLDPALLPRFPADLFETARYARAVTAPKSLQVFFDVARHHRSSTCRPGAWPEDVAGPSALWVSRVLVGPTGWTSDSSEPTLAAGVGNSVVSGCTTKDQFRDIASAYRKMQYLYVLLDIHGRNITALQTAFEARRHRALDRVLGSLDKVQSHLSLLETRTIDVLSGLQGVRARYCKAIGDAWDLAGKQEGVNRKAQIAKSMVDRMSARKSMRYQRIVQFILAGVGVLALADIVVNVTAFSHAGVIADVDRWGLLRAVGAVTADSLLTSTMLVLAVSIVVLAMLFRRG